MKPLQLSESQDDGFDALVLRMPEIRGVSPSSLGHIYIKMYHRTGFCDLK